MWNSFDTRRHERMADSSGAFKPHRDDYGGLVEPQLSYGSEATTDENSGGNISTWIGFVDRPPSSADQRPTHAITDHGEARLRQLPPLLQASTPRAETMSKPQPTSATPASSSSAVSTDSVQAPVKVKKKRIRIKTERRREQCRLNQARYRNKQRSFAVDLENSVAQLRQNVLQLEAQRRSLYFSVNSRESATRLAVEYFRFFYGGLTIVEPRPGSRRPPLEQQILFVTSAFHDNTRVGDDIGCEFFLEQWRRFSTFYDGLRILPQRFTPVIKPEVSTVVETKVILQVTITMTTLRQLYPHLLHPRHSGIKWKMLGQRIDFNSNLDFVFDDDGKIQSVEWTIDFVDALHRFLTIEETAVVLQQAHVVRDAYLLENQACNAREQEDEDDTINQTIWQTSASDAEDNEGYLIHDGKGDDFVMV